LDTNHQFPEWRAHIVKEKMKDTDLIPERIEVKGEDTEAAEADTEEGEEIP